MIRAPFTAHRARTSEPGVENGQLAIERLILSLLEVRHADASICPSEVALAIDPAEWRGLLPVIRLAAIRLASAETIEITQQGVAVEPDGRRRGPTRLRRGPAWGQRD